MAPAPTITTARPASPADRFVGEVGTHRDEGVGRRPDRRLLPHAPAGACGSVEERGQRRRAGAFGAGTPHRLAHLRLDLRLAEHHGVEPARDGEQVLGGVAFPMGVQGLGELFGRDLPGLGQQSLQREESGVIARDVAVDLDPVAGREHHRTVDAVEVLRDPVGLGQVVVGEREPFQQLDRCTTEGDPEGEDRHGR